MSLGAVLVNSFLVEVRVSFLVYWGILLYLDVRFIAKTLYAEEDEDEDPQESTSVEEPKLLGTHPESGEKVLDKKTCD